MKAARTYVFVFVPILLERVANMRGATGFGAGSNGSSPSDEKHNKNSTVASAALLGRRNTGATRSSVLDLVHRQSASAIQQMKTINMSIQKNSAFVYQTIGHHNSDFWASRA